VWSVKRERKEKLYGTQSELFMGIQVADGPVSGARHTNRLPIWSDCVDNKRWNWIGFDRRWEH